MGDDSPAQTAPAAEASNGVAAAVVAQRTPEELVAKSIAPVKKQFLRVPPLRPCSKDQNDAVSEANAQSSVGKEKKSKRQLKRERREVQKSPLGICPEVAKRGDVTRCPYKDKCRYSHDIEAYKAQKPEDIEGECPFMVANEPCPYGLSCRFLGTHKDGVGDGDVNAHRRSSEMNGLSKSVQKLLWKNKVKFTKADAKLKALGLMICGAYPDTVARTVELIEQECTVDFIDINMGCPIDIVVNKGAGSALLTKPMRMKGIVQAASGTVDIPITIKVRTAYFEGKNRIDSLIADMGNWGATAVTIHGRSRQQRYSKLADWEYVYQCAKKSPDSLQVLGNGDLFSYVDWNNHKVECPELSSCMIARGALIKPWVFTEIKEQRHWDITSGERFNILKDYVRCGLEHWGSDTKGVETTRRFLLEWLSYTCRYVPVGLLDVIPQRMSWRPPSYFGRDDLETLMASDSAADWVRLSEMLLGQVPEGFTFVPKHKSNAYDRAENG